MSVKKTEIKYRALSFWSLNGDLKEKELNRQTKIFKEMGFGGAFMHSRCGLATEYMSEKWFSLINSTAEKLNSLGMQAWLYDEDRFPSGSCGGMATEKKENRQKFLSMYVGDFQNIPEDATLVGTFAVNLSGAADKDKGYLGKKLCGYEKLSKESSVSANAIKAVFVIEFAEPSDFYNGNTYLDTLNKNAVKDFIELTHEKYKKACGDKFGKEIKGIFTDEPNRGGVFNGFNLANKNAAAMIPWSYDTFSLYKEIFGENAEDVLPEFFFAKEGEEFNLRIYRYIETLQRQFIAAFIKPYHKWCKDNGLLLTGHVWEENTLLGQINWQGSVMRCYEYMDIPGMDNIREGNVFFAAPIQLSSVAKQTGKDNILSEMYACTGWKTTFDYYKRSGDWQAILGVNTRCPHLSWYTMAGEAKRDCPASIFYQAGWYKEYKYIEDYFARLNMTFGEAEYLTDILLISPIESAWGLVRAGAYGLNERFKELEKDYKSAIDDLCFAGIDFDVADEDIMSRLAEIKVFGGEVKFIVGNMKYKTVIIPRLITLRKTTVNLLKDFEKAGGRIIVIGEKPKYIDGKRADIELNPEIIDDTKKAAEIIKSQNTEYSVNFNGDMLFKLKRAEKGYYAFAVAFSCEGRKTAEISFRGKRNIVKINLRNGKTKGVYREYVNGCTVIKKDFSEGEELLLFIDGESNVLPQRYACKREINLPREFEYVLSEPNVIPLDYADYYIDGEYFGYDEFLKIDKKVREKFGLKERSANNKQPWYEIKHRNKEYNRPLCRIKLIYKFNADIKTDCYIMAERLYGAIYRLNGEKLSRSKKKPFIKDDCFIRYDIRGNFIKSGLNEITVEFDFTESCNIETVFLAGNFAAKEGHPHKIYSLKKRIKFGDICEQGLPFYSGNITYKIPVANGVYDVKNLNFGAALIKCGNKTAAFAPYEITGIRVKDTISLTAVGLRRNLFGPLHETIKNHGNYWSGSFRTEGEKFTSEYQINPQGILSAPEILKRP